MTQLKDNINSLAGKHLTYEERVKIEAYKELGYSNRAVARFLKRAPQTINNAVQRSTVRTIKQRQIHNDKVYEYDQYTYSADADHQTYLRNRQNSGRRPMWLVCDSFTNWADDKMLKKGWSPGVIIGRAMKEKLFSNDLIPCTSTLYHWIDRGIMRIKNIDLLEKVSRNPRNDSPRHRENQHKIVRRFIPKGNRLKEISIQTINRIEKWMNNYPRKILDYQTAKEVFLKELELVVSSRKQGI